MMDGWRVNTGIDRWMVNTENYDFFFLAYVGHCTDGQLSGWSVPHLVSYVGHCTDGQRKELVSVP